ncbi:Sodium channel protein type 11 subunit alpha [Orchesella cincta]|uniref:Sodium channel protein type 11 subunit alpha n=1 Tax=Orchesella cincta TaxID=48709 RepID=A0A1D2MKS0_ORCCI|nr:Sodium channel protein type 11 subunit alpha [Orchesella cincta]
MSALCKKVEMALKVGCKALFTRGIGIFKTTRLTTTPTTSYHGHHFRLYSHHVLSTSGPWSVLFFVMVVFLGSFYLLNLMLAVVAMSYEAEATNQDNGPLTKHQKLSMVRHASTFSFDDLTKLNICKMTYYRKRTPSERELIAKKLRHSSLGKRKPRRAIRRRAISKGSEQRLGSLANTSVGTPRVVSTAGSICGESICGVSTGGGGGGTTVISGGGVSPTCSVPPSTITVPPTSCSILSASSPRGSNNSKRGSSPGVENPQTLSTNVTISTLKEKRKRSSSSGSSGSAKPRKLKQRTAKSSSRPTSGDSRLSDSGHGGDLTSGGGGAGGNNCSASTSLTPVQGDGDDANNMNLGDAIFSLLGLRVNMGAEEVKRLGSMNSITGSILTDNTLSKELVEVDVTGDETGAVAIDIASESSAEADATTALASKNGEALSKGRTVMRQFRKLSLVLKTRLKPIVNHCLFEAFITICIIFNTVLLAMEHHGQSVELEEWLRKGFMAVFTAECIIKLLALQQEFFQVGWNIFDIFIVGISYLDIIIETVLNLSVMRGMRLLRVFKLAQSWITMKVLLNIIFSTFGALGNLTCVLLIVIYIFAVMGMQIVGGQYTPKAFDAIGNPDNFPRWHFQNFWYAFMMVFRVLCGEWIEPLWDCLKAQEMSKKGDDSNAVYVRCFIIYLPILIVGNFIVLNLFLALLLNSFNTEELKAQRDWECSSRKTRVARKPEVKLGIVLYRSVNYSGNCDEPQTQTQLATTVSDPTTPMSDKPQSPATPLDLDSPLDWKMSQETVEPIGRVRFKLVARKVIMQNRKEAAERAITRAENKLKREQNSSFFLKNPDKRASSYGLNQDVSEQPPPDGPVQLVAGDCIPTKCWQSNFFICRNMRLELDKWDRLRGWAVAIVGHPAFEWMILALIFASSITLAFEDVHLEERPQLKKALYILNFVFTGIFLVEMILKWFALASGTTSLVSLVSMYFELRIEFDPDAASDSAKSGASSLAALKALRTLRALRPLRAISRWQGMKIFATRNIPNLIVHKN